MKQLQEFVCFYVYIYHIRKNHHSSLSEKYWPLAIQMAAFGHNRAPGATRAFEYRTRLI